MRYAPPAYRLGKLIGICPCCLLPAPRRESRWVSYLLKGKKVLLSNQVCSTDITYVQTGERHTYLSDRHRSVQPLHRLLEAL